MFRLLFHQTIGILPSHNGISINLITASIDQFSIRYGVPVITEDQKSYLNEQMLLQSGRAYIHTYIHTFMYKQGITT